MTQTQPKLISPVALPVLTRLYALSAIACNANVRRERTAAYEGAIEMYAALTGKYIHEIYADHLTYVQAVSETDLAAILDN